MKFKIAIENGQSLKLSQTHLKIDVSLIYCEYKTHQGQRLLSLPMGCKGA